jgi:hypothetical protein
MNTTHLAIFQEPYYQYIIDGKKLKELRISKTQSPPYYRVMVNDIVYMKSVESNMIEYKFTVMKVEYQKFKVVPDDTEDFLFKHCSALCLTPEFIKSKIGSKYATLMDIGWVVRIDHPFVFHKRDQRSWIVGFQQNRLLIK